MMQLSGSAPPNGKIKRNPDEAVSCYKKKYICTRLANWASMSSAGANRLFLNWQMIVNRTRTAKNSNKSVRISARRYKLSYSGHVLSVSADLATIWSMIMKNTMQERVRSSSDLVSSA